MTNRYRRHKGFTLIELLTVLVILGVILAFAVPSYNFVVVKSRRSDAKAELMQATMGLEQCFTRFNAYDDGACGVATAVEAGYMSDEGWYEISGEVNATDFTLTATPQSSQSTDDTECANFGLDHTGLQTISGSGTVAKCW